MQINGDVYDKICSCLERRQENGGGYCWILKTAKGLCVGDEILPGFYYAFDCYDIAKTKEGRRFICYYKLIDLLVNKCLFDEQPVCSNSDQVLRVLEKMAIPAEIVKEV